MFFFSLGLHVGNPLVNGILYRFLAHAEMIHNHLPDGKRAERVGKMNGVFKNSVKLSSVG